MGRIMAIDYGRKRCGVAVTDVLQICANGLPTVRTCDLISFIKEYHTKENLEEIIIGEPKDMKGQPSESMNYIKPFLTRLKKELTEIPIKMIDERFTSVIAHREMLAGGFKRKERENKGRIDEMSAVLILTSYLESKSRNDSIKAIN